MKKRVPQPDPQPDERQIRSLSDESGAPFAQVRTLFAHELARLKMGAKVGSYLGVLTASNVRGMLRRKARLAAEAAQPVSAVEPDVDPAAVTGRSEGDPSLS